MTTTPAEHLAQVEHNLAVFRHLEGAAPAYLDWQVICLFYAALHLVDAYIAQVTPGGTRTTTHAGRVQQVRRRLPAISSDYVRLKTQSEGARYDLKRFSTGDVAALFTGDFSRIRREVQTALGLST